MTFKQEYLHKNGPFPFNFSEEKANVKDKIMSLIRGFHPNEWALRGFVPLSFLQSYKQVYGISSQQLTEIIIQFLAYLKDESLSCQANISILKTLVGLREYRIKLTDALKFDNKYFLMKLKQYKTYGMPFALKNSDSYVENIIKLIKSYSKFGEEHLAQILQLAIEQRDIKYIAIFIGSIKSEEVAKTILKCIFEESSIFQRDTPFFYIICQLTYEFPKINLASFHQTLSQEIIKSIMTVVDPSTDEELKKLTTEDSYIGVQCTLKSIARIMVNCLRPMSEPGWQKIWSCIERIFSIIVGLIDHSHQVQCINDFLIFLKDFVKMFYLRYRKQNGLYKEVNQDFVQQFQDNPREYRVINSQYINLFDQLWAPLIPELLYLEDGEVQAAKILTDLAMFNPQKHLKVILQQIKSYMQKDLTINSIYTPKMTILFLQQFIILNYADDYEFCLLVQCCQALLDALQKLGISQNLDILELVMRNYMYFPENLMDSSNAIQGLTGDIIEIIEQNLEPMSINLESTQGEDAELYVDFKNIYFNFLIRLSQTQIQNLCDRLLYRIQTMIPSHRQAYEFVVVCLCYKRPEFSIKILDFIYKQVVLSSPQPKTNNGQSQSMAAQFANQALPFHLNNSFATKNQENLRWYCSLIQCAFQYNPENVVTQWGKLQTIICLMLREFDNPNIFDWGLDVLFNIIINLQNIHLEPRQFFKSENKSYQTMRDIKWIFPSTECVSLLENIKNNYYDATVNFLQNKYEKILIQSDKAQRIRSQKVIELVFDRSESNESPRPIQIKQFMNEILDCLLVPSAPTPEDMQERKLINKVLSIQYSVFSALQMRACYTNSKDMFQISPMFIREMGCFRKHAIQYLKWVLELLGHYNCMYDEGMIKLFHFFWRQAHDELFFSSGIQATNDKLNPFFYPVLYKKKQLFENPFLITTECYVTFMMRIQLFHMLEPMACLNNPQYLQYLVPFCYSSYLDCSLKSYIPAQIDPHQMYHFQVLNISRLKLFLNYSSSYIRKFIVYSKAGNEGMNKIEKQKYLGAIRVIIANYKRNISVFLHPCCLRDQTSWYAIQETIQVTQYLQKKNDKVGVIEIIYLLIVFSFDFKGNQMYEVDLRKVDKKLVQLVGNDQTKLDKVVKYVGFLIAKIRSEIIKKFYEKDATVLVLLLVCYSQYIPIHHQIFKQIIPLAFQITFKNTQDMMNMGKSFLFRIINRFIKKKVEIMRVQNCPIKRDFQDFLTFRHIGGRTLEGSQEPPYNLVTSKSDNYYYPLRYLEFLSRGSMDPNEPIEALMLAKLNNQETMRQVFKSLLADTELKSQELEVDVSYLSEEEPKRIYSNGHKLINYILDSNPKKLDIYLSFIDNFSNYPICFYHRLFRKMMILGGSRTVEIFQKVSQQFIKSNEKEEVKLSQFLLAELLPFSFNNAKFYQFYTNYLVTCSNQEFDFANGCLLVTFCVDWKISKIIFNRIIEKLRAEKGPSRLRHFDVFNNYLLCAGRFAQEEAKNGIKYLMGGIEEGTDQVSQLIVSMLIYCFIIPINLNEIPSWVNESTSELILNKRIYKLDSNTGYSINELVRMIIGEIINKTSQQKHLESKNLMIYSKVTYKILSNITVYRFNEEFYTLFKDMMMYLINKPVEEGGYDQEIVSQFKDSQYPQRIYQDLLKELMKMDGNTVTVVKKKLKYIQSMVINKIYGSDEVNIPNIFCSMNQKNVTIDHIVAASNMARIMKSRQLTREVQKILALQQKNLQNLNFMMAYLLAAGTRSFDWTEKILKEILSFKKHKIVKEFVSYWWKGRSPENQNEQRLYMLVRSVQNPYSYFA